MDFRDHFCNQHKTINTEEGTLMKIRMFTRMGATLVAACLIFAQSASAEPEKSRAEAGAPM